ncbi:ATP-binding protein [Actinoplanes sp. NEAU-A12]|uniref:ATP-binding protein n=1 Tax=Actinoplanes sandaracinus TaxID=3045177 RepID=A0ABT6WTI8_9ACTN|nr:ATP-binding protein [Actinoplanes sandaracinus]MDI6103057.1 ATP-binding protein [Actinoplanes sandaracinus]
MSHLRSQAPPARACLLLSWELTNDQDLRRIRAELHHFFTARELDEPARNDDIAQRIGLVATELGGNALRHGMPPIVVRLLRDEDGYILDVSDHDPHHAPESAELPQQFRAGGRGLHIVRSLTRQLCWYATEDVKHVWASFPAPHERPRSTPRWGAADVVPPC